MCEPLYLLIANKNIPFMIIAQSFYGHWDYSVFLHLKTNNFLVDETTPYSWCALIEYNFAACCKSTFELKIWPTMNSPPKFPILVFHHEVQSLEMALPMFSTFLNYKDGAKWNWTGEISIVSLGSGLFDISQHSSSTETYIPY